MAKIFADVSENEITRTISMMFSETIDEYANCDVIIIGAGPAGLMASRGMDPMWVEGGEDSVVNYTDEVFPGLIAVGMSVTETNGLPRMGPTFGSMLLSGKKGAEVALHKLKETPEQPKLKVK